MFFVFKYVSEVSVDKNKSSYLISLRENSTIGCSSFSQFDNNILVIGDSHSYAAFDFYKFSELTKTKKISSCTMGGLYFASVVQLMKKIKQSNNYPSNIIFGLSLRQFTSGLDMDKQLSEHSKLIENVDYKTNIFMKIKDNLNFSLKIMMKSESVLELRNSLINYWNPIISQLNSENIDDIFKTLNNSSKMNWNKFINSIEFLDSNDENIRQFCEIIKDTKIKLFLVDIPESPYLKKQYSVEQINKYELIMNQLASCAERLVVMSYNDWGIENRHFLNRSLSLDLDLSVIEKKIIPESLEQRNLMFDLDHLNIIGSQIVTNKVFDKISEKLIYAF